MNTKGTKEHKGACPRKVSTLLCDPSCPLWLRFYNSFWLFGRSDKTLLKNTKPAGRLARQRVCLGAGKSHRKSKPSSGVERSDKNITALRSAPFCRRACDAAL